MDQLDSHAVSIRIDASAEAAFGFVSDPGHLGLWAFERAVVDDHGLACGQSRFDGSPVFARVDADHTRLTIDFRVGDHADHLTPRIMARVIPGPRLDLRERQCGLTLLAWRSATMDDFRWRKLVASHELEICLLKELIEHHKK